MTEFLSYYYIAPKSIKDIESDCEQIASTDQLVESNLTMENTVIQKRFHWCLEKKNLRI